MAYFLDPKYFLLRYFELFSPKEVQNVSANLILFIGLKKFVQVRLLHMGSLLSCFNLCKNNLCREKISTQ